MRKLVWVEWFDTASNSTWRTQSTSCNPMLVKSIGWLVEDAKDCLKISNSMETDDPNDPLFVDPLAIPKGAIIAWGEISMVWK